MVTPASSLCLASSNALIDSPAILALSSTALLNNAKALIAAWFCSSNPFNEAVRAGTSSEISSRLIPVLEPILPSIDFCDCSVMSLAVSRLMPPAKRACLIFSPISSVLLALAVCNIFGSSSSSILLLSTACLADSPDSPPIIVPALAAACCTST